jgi:predicted  nucleic acid-binding Zn-ribbon protein
MTTTETKNWPTQEVPRGDGSSCTMARCPDCGGLFVVPIEHDCRVKRRRPTIAESLADPGEIAATSEAAGRERDEAEHAESMERYADTLLRRLDDAAAVIDRAERDRAALLKDLRDAENQRDGWAKIAADWQEEYRLLVEGIETVIAQGEARAEVLKGAEGKAD